MKLTLIAHIQDHGSAGFIAWIDSIKGLVVEAKTKDEVCKELITSLKVKLAHDLGLPASQLKEVDEQEMKAIQRTFAMRNKGEICEQELSLTLS